MASPSSRQSQARLPWVRRDQESYAIDVAIMEFDEVEGAVKGPSINESGDTSVPRSGNGGLRL
jgi:hypothetical protein